PRRQRAALLAAGSELLATQGVDAVTPAAVGAAAGLARSSVYQYFDSSPALLAAIIEDAFPRATEQLRSAVGKAATPAAKIDAYVRTALVMASDPAHRSLYALVGVELPAACRARLDELHQEQYAPLRAALVDLAVPDTDLTLALVHGLVGAATQAIIAGAPRKRVETRLLALIHSGLRP
ncbi:MAG TPA: TetR/AcrR family transcriptional regulator, partial [Dermatophilaceae bacterium]